ncbi:MAG: Dihydrofolate reductase [Candidatus Moranbacteria bacterium GW2011_GWA2_39_41]|nr:MAG: Dihydrofolate reductase [Candidatus Moranbacteria bacterium GW2011_GWA2_39_41]
MISLIVAIGKNNAIGRNNQLLWNIPEDMKHFKKITTSHTVIMGDRTYLSIGRPLPNRKNIVVSLDENFVAEEGCEISHDLFKTLDEYKNSDEEVFVVGGGMIYKLSLPMVDKLYLTIVDDAPEDADTFFPDYSEFNQIVKEENIDNGQYKFKFLELIKK